VNNCESCRSTLLFVTKPNLQVYVYKSISTVTYLWREASILHP